MIKNKSAYLFLVILFVCTGFVFAESNLSYVRSTGFYTISNPTDAISYRFTAPRTMNVDGMLMYVGGVTGVPTFLFTIEEDDGFGNPSGIPVNDIQVYSGVGANSWQYIGTQVCPLYAGTVYHFVIRGVNSLSGSAAFAFTMPSTHMYPFDQRPDLSMTMLAYNGAWTDTGDMPVFLLHEYAGITGYGNPYVAPFAYPIHGNRTADDSDDHIAGEKLNVSATNTFNGIGVYVNETGAPSTPLIYTIVDPSDNVIATGVFCQPSNAGPVYTWISAATANFTLNAGINYYLYFSSPGAGSDSLNYYTVAVSDALAGGNQYFNSMTYNGTQDAFVYSDVNVSGPWNELQDKDLVYTLNPLVPEATPTFTPTNVPTVFIPVVPTETSCLHRDATFSQDGIVYNNNAAGGNGYDAGEKMTVDLAGRYLVTGSSTGTDGNQDMAVWCYKPDGTLDTSFGGSGTGYFTHGNAAGGNGTDAGTGILTDASGKIYVCGSSENVSNNDAVIWRLNSNGTLDTTFNGTGYRVYDNGMDDYAAGICIDSSGKIVMGGTSEDINFYNAAVWRLNPDGSPDTTFNGTGFVSVNAAIGSTQYEEIEGIQIDAAGRIVATGYSTDSMTGGNKTVVYRFLPSGALDPAFNTTGIKVITDPLVADDNSFSSAIAIDGAGNIYIGGQSDADALTTYMMVWKLKDNGAFDTTFGGTGYMFLPGTGRESVTGINIDYDNSIWATGYSFNGLNQDFAVWKIKQDGTLDPMLNGTGKYILDNVAGGHGRDRAEGQYFDVSGAIFLVGESRGLASNYDMGLVKLVNICHNTPTPTITPSSTITPTFTVTLTSTITQSITQTVTPSITGTVTPTNTPTFTPSDTKTVTQTVTPTTTTTASPTSTASVTRTDTPTITMTNTLTCTPSATCSITPTHEKINFVTYTCTPTATATYNYYTGGDIIVYPNPYNPGVAIRGKCKIINLPQYASVFIYDLSGEFIVECDEKQGEAEWNGTNRGNTPVSAGIYYFDVLDDARKSICVGKIFLVRK